MNRLVIDSSISMSWYFADEADPYAQAILRYLGKVEAIVPAIWLIEVANVLLVGERRGRETAASAARFIALLRSFPIEVESPQQWGIIDDILAIGRQFNLSSYDASYLELAMREGLPLATLDNRLIQAANAVGVPLAVV